ncbi:HAD-superfamily hydrolase, subfamily IA, variant 3 [Clostridium carboxidivorans P7]|uniref:HAD-superfamily hydrolase, subfamily IA, variant 3 n=2 Tax=Clostridium TaxID=1485 RepID=C6Q097_9CLOT|nr:HAD-superfamily hydrolase, subfamily IA, variant 3 [Clostridium carboxidivorans P7]
MIGGSQVAMSTNIKAILFDSGRVLNYPKSGNWFITPSFFKYVDKDVFNSISKNKKKVAFKKAYNYINSCKLIKTQEEEYGHFIKYYNIFFKELPELDLKTDAVKGIAKDLVYNPQKYIFFDEVVNVISILSKKYKLGIVSDAWPSLNMVFEAAELKNYFSTFVVSSMLGATKPESIMYQTALDELGVLPENTVFIDDNLKNCIGANKLGIHSVLLCRIKFQYVLNKVFSVGKGYDVINNLHQLTKIKCMRISI